MFIALTLALVVAGKAISAGIAGAVTGVSWLVERPARRRALVEAELDRTEAQLRRAVLELAQELSDAGLEARKEMIRQSYLASGQPPHRD